MEWPRRAGICEEGCHPIRADIRDSEDHLCRRRRLRTIGMASAMDTSKCSAMVRLRGDSAGGRCVSFMHATTIDQGCPELMDWERQEAF